MIRIYEFQFSLQIRIYQLSRHWRSRFLFCERQNPANNTWRQFNESVLAVTYKEIIQCPIFKSL
jgi:hypothetical protein